MAESDPELLAYAPGLLKEGIFNPRAKIPYGCKIYHLQNAMNDFLEFLGFINLQLRSKQIQRLESFLMPANFSSMVGEFMAASIPKYCSTIAKNCYHNGHPDLIPAGMYEANACRYAPEGIEIKGSRHTTGWQGHNPEDVWLMVFVFDSNTPRDPALDIAPKPFRFVKVIGAKLTKKDWSFSGRSATSRRTITASVTRTGYKKMEDNWIYRGAPA